MRKWLRPILIILLLIAFLPAGFGLLAKRSLDHLLANLVLPQGMSLSLEDYTFGWLSSYAAINIHIAEATPQYASHKAIDILVHGNITHGPLFATTQGLGLGIGRVDLHADLKDIKGLMPSVQTELQQMFGDAHLLYASSIFHLNRAVTLDVHSSPMNASAAGDSIQWSGLQAQATINSTFDTLQAQVDIAPVLFSTAQGGMLDTAPARFVAQLERQGNSPWMGEQVFTLPAFYLKDETGSQLRFDHLRMVSLSSMIDDLLHASLNVEAQNIAVAGHAIDQLYFALDLDNIASAPLLRISQLMGKTNTLSASETQELFHDLIKALAPGADIEFNYILNMKEERVSIHALLAFSDINDTLSESLIDNSQLLLAGLNGKVEALAPQQFIKDLLLQQMQGAQRGLSELTPQIDDYLSALTQQGILLAQDQSYQFELDYQQGKILLNDRALTQDEIYLLLMLLSQAIPHASITP